MQNAFRILHLLSSRDMNCDWYTIHRITAIKLLITFVFITFPKEKENFEASFTENHMLQLCLLEIVSFFFTEVTRQTKDLDVRVIIIDYESNDINIEAVLNKSSLRQFTVVRIPREKDFKRAVALHLGAEAVKDPHSVLFLCDLHLKIPSNLISTIRKVRGI